MTPRTPITQIRLSAVTKLFGVQRALRKVSFDAHQGDTVGIVGPNGAGKSTLLSILSTMMKPTMGQVEMNGRPADADMRAGIGVLSHKALVYPELSCEENLKLYGELYGVSVARVQHLKDLLELGAFFSDRPAGVLSKGQLQRLSLARALIASPEVLLLDEPSSGLDKRSIILIQTIVTDHQDAGGIAFVVSHDPELVSSLCTRVIQLELGEIKADTTTTDAAEISAMLEGAVP